MKEMLGKIISFHDVTLRDGQQSMAATRMTTEQCLKVLPLIEAAGYESIELWGGAILDSCIQYLDEDPWERLELFAQRMKDSGKIQALLRGQNLFGYKPYADDLVIAFIKQSIQSGVKTMRLFDALNDRRNLQTPMLATKAYGGVAEAAMSYSTSPVYGEDAYVAYAMQLVEDGADRICLKDMAGLLEPSVALTLLPKLRENVKVPLTLHAHSSTGTSMLNALIAMFSGFDAIDTAIAPFSEGSSHPSIEIMTVFAEELGLEHGLDGRAIQQAQKELFVIAHDLCDFNPQLEEYYCPFTSRRVDCTLVKQVVRDLTHWTSEGLEDAQDGCRALLDSLNFPPVDERMFACQIPGGMLTNLKWQLEQMGASHILGDVMAEIPRVRSDAGYVPLVTPTSQIIGAQATNNVLAGHRYEIVSDEFRMLLNGELGRTPVSPNQQVVLEVLGNECVEDRYRPGSYLTPVLEDVCDLPYVKSNKDLMLHHLFGAKADEFLKRRRDVEDESTNWFEVQHW